MPTARIAPGQLFSLLALFMLGSAWLFGLGAEARQDAWLASLAGVALGLPLMGLYLLIQRHFPEQTLVQYLPLALGKVVGKWLALGYVLYFLYLAARVTRDFTELLVMAILPRTPAEVVAIALVLLTGYAVRHGLVVVARAAQVLLPLGFGLILIATIGVWADFRPENLLPVLEEGGKGIWKATFPLTITVPFGETVLFGMIWPAVSSRRVGATLGAGAAAGLFLSYLSLINIGVQGAHIVGSSEFPLLTLVHQIRLPGMFERPDALVAMVLVLGGFMKIGLFYFGAAGGLAQWLGLADFRPLVLPVGTMVAALCFLIAGTYPEHIDIGLKRVPYTLHIPAQMIVPLLVLAAIKAREIHHRWLQRHRVRSGA